MLLSELSIIKIRIGNAFEELELILRQNVFKLMLIQYSIRVIFNNTNFECWLDTLVWKWLHGLDGFMTDLWAWWRTLHVTKCRACWIPLPVILIQIPLHLHTEWRHFSSDSHPSAERETIVKLWILSNPALILPEILYKLLIHADSYAVLKTFSQLHKAFQSDSTLIYF